MWNYRYISRMDFRFFPVLLSLMFMSLLVISANTMQFLPEGAEETFFTPNVRVQIQSYCLGTLCYFFLAGFDYNKLREWTWFLYAIMIVLLVGVFFTSSIQQVYRWYRIPFIGVSFQPSEYAKLVVVIALSWFLERRSMRAELWSTVFYAWLIVAIPFILILKQPDLGTALVLFPITLVMFYFGNLRPFVIKVMSTIALIALGFVALKFLGIIPHEEIRPFMTKFIKDYQFDRLDPHTHHQHAAATAIAVGGMTGAGFRQGEFTSGGWLPAAYTDSVFPAFGEEYGFLGLALMLGLFYLLFYLCFQVVTVAKDPFGRLLAAGITVYLAMHILVNIGMMTGFLPITGVPLILVSYGGSSVLSTMIALGILQSIYSRRFMF